MKKILPPPTYPAMFYGGPLDGEVGKVELRNNAVDVTTYSRRSPNGERFEVLHRYKADTLCGMLVLVGGVVALRHAGAVVVVD